MSLALAAIARTQTGRRKPLEKTQTREKRREERESARAKEKTEKYNIHTHIYIIYKTRVVREKLPARWRASLLAIPAAAAAAHIARSKWRGKKSERERERERDNRVSATLALPSRARRTCTEAARKRSRHSALARFAAFRKKGRALARQDSSDLVLEGPVPWVLRKKECHQSFTLRKGRVKRCYRIAEFHLRIFSPIHARDRF